MALKLGISPDEILKVRQAIAPHDNLTITQIVDMGRLGMQRGADQQRRVAAIVRHYQTIDSTTKVITSSATKVITSSDSPQRAMELGGAIRGA